MHKQVENSKSNDKIEKIEVCYLCGKEFNINEDDESHYHYGQFPMCDYCSEFYGFYKKDR
ncbi:hypothetical protein MBCUT_06150 [Methanobrevibacter cuticularis]|uniref:C2H2-type domain-containing protein n=1 Tax=Methanobrevibacter cuticularis TaxID=47311 RepID=A0A166EKA4_9EURY|nr:hypothetical protein [Methanobrevibacter cuticularis]KZX16751.1 hypothetical protein MBCUT_06150 [Methanobrevibacter cuticularis]